MPLPSAKIFQLWHSSLGKNHFLYFSGHPLPGAEVCNAFFPASLCLPSMLQGNRQERILVSNRECVNCFLCSHVNLCPLPQTLNFHWGKVWDSHSQFCLLQSRKNCENSVRTLPRLNYWVIVSHVLGGCCLRQVGSALWVFLKQLIWTNFCLFLTLSYLLIDQKLY